MQTSRYVRQFVLPLLLGPALVVTATPFLAQASVSNATTDSVIAAAKAAMAKQAGVHVSVISKNGKTSSTVMVDIGVTSGKETITSGTQSVTILVTPSYAYLSGSASGLTAIMGFSPAQQKKIGSHVMSMKVGTKPYSNLQRNLTVSVLTGLLPVVKGTTLSSASGINAKDYKLSWSTKATASSPKISSVLIISAGAKTLPLKEKISSSTGSGTTTFSNWGENVHVSVPSSASILTYKQVFG